MLRPAFWFMKLIHYTNSVSTLLIFCASFCSNSTLLHFLGQLGITQYYLLQ